MQYLGFFVTKGKKRMNIIQILILAFALSMDAFAVSVVLGLGMEKATFKRALIVALYFGLFQAAMPLIGFLIASLFANAVQAIAHWIAFALLLTLGAKMLLGVLLEKKKAQKEQAAAHCKNDKQISVDAKEFSGGVSLKPKTMIPYAIATSIDALAVGVSFAVLAVNIFYSVAIIGVITLGMCLLAVKIGSKLGKRVKSKAEIIGGVILIALAFTEVLSYFGLLPF